MQSKQTLWFESREEFYNWIVSSELAISKEELEANDNKKFIIHAPLNTIKSYVDLTNYYVCDCMQTIIWMKEIEGEKNPAIQAIPIMINSDKLELKVDEDKAPQE